MFGDFPISEDYKLWRQDKEFLTTYKRLSPDNPYSQDRKFTLREFVRLTHDVPGEMAECGCYKGSSAYFMAEAAPDTPLSLFDSFAGLSTPTDSDVPPDTDHPAWGQGDLATTEDTVRSRLGPFPLVQIYKGWIPDRFEEVADRQFRLVHIDVDLYQPTLDSLAFFYPRMGAGGVIVLDDYGFTNCPGAFKAAQDFMADKPEYVASLTTGQGLIIKR
jgi:O-methyltransferase